MQGRQPDARVYCDPNEIEDALVYARCHETWQDDAEICDGVWDMWGDDWRIRFVVPAVRTYKGGAL